MAQAALKSIKTVEILLPLIPSDILPKVGHPHFYFAHFSSSKDCGCCCITSNYILLLLLVQQRGMRRWKSVVVHNYAPLFQDVDCDMGQGISATYWANYKAKRFCISPSKTRHYRKPRHRSPQVKL